MLRFEDGKSGVDNGEEGFDEVVSQPTLCQPDDANPHLRRTRPNRRLRVEGGLCSVSLSKLSRRPLPRDRYNPAGKSADTRYPSSAICGAVLPKERKGSGVGCAGHRQV